MPQLEKYAFFTQLFWFFSVFFLFFFLLLKTVLPAIARSLKFRTKVLRWQKAALHSFQTEDLSKHNSLIALDSLNISKNFALHVQNFSKVLHTKNVLLVSRSHYFVTTYLYILQNRNLQKKILRQRSQLLKALKLQKKLQTDQQQTKKVVEKKEEAAKKSSKKK